MRSWNAVIAVYMPYSYSSLDTYLGAYLLLPPADSICPLKEQWVQKNKQKDFWEEHIALLYKQTFAS